MHIRIEDVLVGREVVQIVTIEADSSNAGEAEEVAKVYKALKEALEN